MQQVISVDDMRGHDLSNPDFIHTDFQAVHCSCQVYGHPQAVGSKPAVKSFEGRVCAACGGSNFIRTGSCHTCTDCGASDGCG